MNIVILDLEWNGAYSRRLHGFINEIIEFGAVKLDAQLNITDRFSCFVKPQVTKKISAIISDLTNITDANLLDARPYMQVMSRFKKWAGDCVIATWGTSDILALIENCRYFGGGETVPFLQRYVDLQQYVEKRLGEDGKEQLGLSKAAELLSIDDGALDHHRALDDSVLSAMVLERIYTKDTFRPFIQDCKDPEFYRRITFKTTYICDVNSPLIEKEHLHFTCEKCGGEAKRRGKWTVKNKSLNIIMFVYLFSISMAQGGAICIGHLIGEKKPHAAFLLGKYVMKKSVMITLILSGIIAASGHAILSWLTSNPEIIRMGVIVLLIDVVLEIGRPINIFATNALRAAGDVNYPFYVGLVVMWSVAVGIGYLFGIYWAWGICGMWVAFALDENIRGIIFVRRWYGMKWVNKSFVRS